MDKHIEAISYLNRLPIEELVRVFEAVFRKHKPEPGEDQYYSARYCLAIASREKLDQSEEWESAEVELVAYPDPAKGYEAGPGWGLCQSGQCVVCGLQVRSNYKHGICPACSNSVYMT